MKKYLAIFTVFMMVLSLCACGSSAPKEVQESKGSESSQGEAAPGGDKAPEGDKPTIVMIPQAIGNEFYVAGQQGAIAAAGELGIDFIYDGPTSPQVDQQVEFINTYIAAGVDAICIAPLDSNAIAPILQEARDAGIKVIAYDIDASSGRDWYMTPCVATRYGEVIVDYMVEQAGASDIEWIFLVESLGDEFQKAAAERAVAYAAEKFPDLVFHDIKQLTQSQDAAYKEVTDLLKVYPNLRGVCSIGTIIFPGIIEAIKDTNNVDKIANVGMGTPNAIRGYIKDGSLKTSLMWDAVDMGYAAIYTAYNSVTGTLKEGDTTLDCGKLGTLQISEGGIIIQGDPLAFEAGNIDNYDF